MTALCDTAAKCRNPVVRNALLAAAGGGERDAAEKIAARQRGKAWRDWTFADERQWARIHVGIKAKLKDDPAFILECERGDGMADAARIRYNEARNALRALRRVGTAQTHHGGAARP